MTDATPTDTEDPHGHYPAHPRTFLGHPSVVLLVAQLGTVLAYPFLDTSTAGRAALGVVQIGVVTLALWAVRRTPALSWVAVLLGVPAMAFSILEATVPDADWVMLTSGLVHAPFYFYVTYAMIRYLFHDEKVTRDELFATGATFTVLAWAFAYVYLAVQVIWPGSFLGVEGAGDRTWFELLFLSFTTLTSVGLSDITPALAHARSFVMIEQLTGVLYIAMVITRLVSLTVLGKQR